MLTSVFVPCTVNVCGMESLLVTVRVASGATAMQPGAKTKWAMLTDVDACGCAQPALGGFEQPAVSSAAAQIALIATNLTEEVVFVIGWEGYRGGPADAG